MGEKNHYRVQGPGMVSMGSEEDMFYSDSIERPVYSLPEGGNTNGTVGPAVQAVTNITPSLVNRNTSNFSTTELPEEGPEETTGAEEGKKVESSSLDSSLERAPQTLSRASGELTFLDYLFVDDKLVGATLAKMSNMLDTYFSDR